MMQLHDFTSLLAQLEGGYLSPYWLLAPIRSDKLEDPLSDPPHIGALGRWAYHPAAVWLKTIAPERFGDAHLIDWQGKHREWFRTALWRSMFFNDFNREIRTLGLGEFDFEFLCALVEVAPSVRWGADSSVSALGHYPLAGRQISSWTHKFNCPAQIPATIAAAYTRAIKLELLASYQRVLSLLAGAPVFHRRVE